MVKPAFLRRKKKKSKSKKRRTRNAGAPAPPRYGGISGFGGPPLAFDPLASQPRFFLNSGGYGQFQATTSAGPRTDLSVPVTSSVPQAPTGLNRPPLPVVPGNGAGGAVGGGGGGGGGGDGYAARFRRRFPNFDFGLQQHERVATDPVTGVEVAPPPAGAAFGSLGATLVTGLGAAAVAAYSSTLRGGNLYSTPGSSTVTTAAALGLLASGAGALTSGKEAEGETRAADTTGVGTGVNASFVGSNPNTNFLPIAPFGKGSPEANITASRAAFDAPAANATTTVTPAVYVLNGTEPAAYPQTVLQPNPESRASEDRIYAAPNAPEDVEPEYPDPDHKILTDKEISRKIQKLTYGNSLAQTMRWWYLSPYKQQKITSDLEATLRTYGDTVSDKELTEYLAKRIADALVA